MFTRLIHHARQPESPGRLTAWWSEERCARSFGDIVRPDAYGRWEQGRGDVEWFLELDFGTETLRRLTFKVNAYDRLAEATNIHTPILIWTTTLRREARLREVLAETLGGPRPSGAGADRDDRRADLAEPDEHLDATLTRWLPLARPGTGRLSLVQLAGLWPPTARPLTRPDRTEIDIDVERPRRLSPPQPMPPTGLDEQQRAESEAARAWGRALQVRCSASAGRRGRRSAPFTSSDSLAESGHLSTAPSARRAASGAALRPSSRVLQARSKLRALAARDACSVCARSARRSCAGADGSAQVAVVFRGEGEKPSGARPRGVAVVDGSAATVAVSG